MNQDELVDTARRMMADGKGILAADESTGTITKRLAAVSVESTEDTRRAYRELLFTAPEIENYISGVILYDETIRQSASNGETFPALLVGRGILPGIKVDKGAKDLAGHPGEKVTEGLDGLRERFAEYYELGARFTKWRAVIAIDGANALPSAACIEANAHALARYAALAQEAGIVPIVEPEVLIDGAHDQAECEATTRRTLRCLFAELEDQGVLLEGTVLKPSMVISGKQCGKQSSVLEVAEATLRTMKRHVPAAIGGIAFLSGGQTPEQASAHLNAMNRAGPLPWPLTFSYARALQNPVLALWKGDAARAQAAAAAFTERARLNHLARQGEYEAAMEKAAAA
ncbi:MAG: fructose-bisphosphate aldolase class I [Gammaproteobacteria bacterium]|nr:fructose-bisphosphate aldolase class I [Gammaproteobacteria bacterium]